MLTVGPGEGFYGSGTINDPVACQGWIEGSISVNGGFSMSGSTTVSVGGLTTDDTSSGMTGGALTVWGHIVGYSGTGNFAQSGGTNTITDWIPLNWPIGPSIPLCLGYNLGSSGTYILSGSGQLSAEAELVGYNGTGAFVQSGGTNTISNFYSAGQLYLGYNPGSSGTYTMGGAGIPSLSASSEYSGYSGTGSFVQSGGINTVNNSIYLGYNSGSSGTYGLSGSGQLIAGTAYVGYSGTGASAVGRRRAQSGAPCTSVTTWAAVAHLT